MSTIPPPSPPGPGSSPTAFVPPFQTPAAGAEEEGGEVGDAVGAAGRRRGVAAAVPGLAVRRAAGVVPAAARDVRAAAAEVGGVGAVGLVVRPAGVAAIPQAREALALVGIVVEVRPGLAPAYPSLDTEMSPPLATETVPVARKASTPPRDPSQAAVVSVAPAATETSV